MGKYDQKTLPMCAYEQFQKNKNISKEKYPVKTYKENLKDLVTTVSLSQPPTCSRPWGSSSPFSVVLLCHLKSVPGAGVRG